MILRNDGDEVFTVSKFLILVFAPVKIDKIKEDIQILWSPSEGTEIIFSSIKELALTSQNMAGSMAQISSAMKELEGNNEELKRISGTVEDRAGSLNTDCLKFTIWCV